VTCHDCQTTCKRFGKHRNGLQRYRCSLCRKKAAVTLYIAFYNFCRVQASLKATPAMQAGIADHVWTVGELLAL
jgi:transposase-like protein